MFKKKKCTIVVLKYEGRNFVKIKVHFAMYKTHKHTRNKETTFFPDKKEENNLQTCTPQSIARYTLEKSIRLVIALCIRTYFELNKLEESSY